MRRRTVLGAVGTSLTLAISGCLGDDSDSDQPGGDETDGGDGGETSSGTTTETTTPKDGATEDRDGPSQAVPEITGGWRTFQGDTANTGTGKGTATGPATEPTVDWKVTADDEMQGAPVIVDGTVLAGSWDNTLYAVELSSGDERWTFDAGGSQSSPVAVASETVFLGAGETVAALDIESGEPYWTTTIESRCRGGPVVGDGQLYVPTQDKLLAMSAASGDQLWDTGTAGPIPSTPHLTDETVYFTSADGNIYAVSTDGETRWQKRISSSGGFPSPTAVDGTVYFGWGDGTLYALNASDGIEQWTDRAGGEERVAVTEGTAYIASYPLKAIGTQDHVEQWTTEEPEGLFTNFTVGTGRVYLGNDEAETFAYDRETGEQQWRFQDNYSVETSLAIDEGYLVYGDEFGNLVALS